MLLPYYLSLRAEEEMQLFVLLAILVGINGGSCERPADWLIKKITNKVTCTQSSDNNYLTLSNGLINRTFTLHDPGFGTIDYRSEMTSRSILRALVPEAYVTLDGTEYPIGGVVENVHHSYLNRTNLDIAVLSASFVYSSHKISEPEAPFHWEPGLRHAPTDLKWPPEGLTLTVELKSPENVSNTAHSDIVVRLNYEMYQGVPILAKWLTVENLGNTPVRVDKVTIENLATQKPYAPLEMDSFPWPWQNDPASVTSSWLYVEASTPHGANISWATDPRASDSPGADEPLLTASYTVGPGVIVGRDLGHYRTVDRLKRQPETVKKSGPRVLQSFDTYKVLELVTDSNDRERVAMSRHRMVRLLAPQTQENPIFFHGTNTSDAGFRTAIDQMEEVGYEMFIFSFGSDFNMEDMRDEALKRVAANVAYAKKKGIEVGGYDLIDLARGHGAYGGNVGDQWDNTDANGHLTSNACFASGWYDVISTVIFDFFERTGLSMIETDGPYGGQTCYSKDHSHHLDEEDSVYWQNRLQAELFMELKERNVFINQPDEYFHAGGNKLPLGYSEYQYSLPRWEDLSVSRAAMYDDTYDRIPTQGWMFLPLIEYHSGGAAAMFEPLSDHYLEYEWGLAQYLGYGVAACYRGPRLYDNNGTMALVKKWVNFYKTYRDIVTSDIVHVRRPNMQDYDCILHVNPFIENRGLAMVFNPTDSHISANITLPLYYTGISNQARVATEGTLPWETYTLERDYSITLSVSMGPKTITWFLIHSGDE